MCLRPFYWAEGAGFSSIVPGADSTRWCLCIYEAPIAKTTSGISITLSPYRRPTRDSAPLEPKASCLYPNNARAMVEAHARGFDNCVLLDQDGHVAELAIANIFMAKDGTVFTPAANGTFLDGITRQRVIHCYAATASRWSRKALRYADFETADEIFSSGNLHKVQAVTRIDSRALQPGPMFRKARELYWAFRVQMNLICRSSKKHLVVRCESRDFQGKRTERSLWIPAFAGMTMKTTQ